MSIFYVDNTFDCISKNPYENYKSYSSDWILIKLLDNANFKQFTGGGANGIFRLIITKQIIDWAFRLYDFIGYETLHNKNIIVAVNEVDLIAAREIYRNHTFKDKFLRPYEQKILMHTTSEENYKVINNQ